MDKLYIYGDKYMDKLTEKYIYTLMGEKHTSMGEKYTHG